MREVINTEEKHSISWRKAMGSELLSAVIILLGMIIIIAIVVFYSTYDAAIQSQTVADAIVDGSVAYAQNNMNVAEIPARMMAEKIYKANQDISNSMNLIRLNSYDISFRSPLENMGLFKDEERKFLEKRAEIVNNENGPIATTHYHFYQPELNDLNHGYTVNYYGPRYKDELITVTVNAHIRVPFSESFDRTSRASTIAIAEVPYNSRADKKASSRLYSCMTKLEEIAYKEATMTDSDMSFSSNSVPQYGSLAQKVILEARRYLGDGYARDKRINTEPLYWPRLKWAGDETCYAPYSSNTMYTNSYKDCYSFVNACFKVNGMSGYEMAQQLYETTRNKRNISYTRRVKAEDIWYELHESDSHTFYIETDPEKLAGNFKAKGSGFFTTAELYCIQPRGKSSGEYFDIDEYEVEWLNTYGTMLRVYKKPISLAEAKDKYAGQGGGEPCYAIAGAEKWNINDLSVGDVLVFSDPNWNKLIYDELDTIYNAPSADSPSVQELNRTDGKDYVCHYGLYIGNGKMIECTATDNEEVNGVVITPLGNINWNGEPANTLMLSVVNSFGERYQKKEQVLEKIGMGGVEGNLITYGGEK